MTTERPGGSGTSIEDLLREKFGYAYGNPSTLSTTASRPPTGQKSYFSGPTAIYKNGRPTAPVSGDSRFAVRPSANLNTTMIPSVPNRTGSGPIGAFTPTASPTGNYWVNPGEAAGYGQGEYPTPGGPTPTSIVTPPTGQTYGGSGEEGDLPGNETAATGGAINTATGGNSGLGAIGDLIDPQLLASIMSSITSDGSTVTGARINANGDLEIDIIDIDGNPQKRIFNKSVLAGSSEYDKQQLQLDKQRADLDAELKRADAARADKQQEIDRLLYETKLSLDAAIAQGDWKQAQLLMQREEGVKLAERQLERDKFNAELTYTHARYDLDRQANDLDKLKFLQSLSTTPGNYVDLWNITRGLAPVGGGGPLPGGLQQLVPRTGQANGQSLVDSLFGTQPTVTQPVLGAEAPIDPITGGPSLNYTPGQTAGGTYSLAGQSMPTVPAAGSPAGTSTVPGAGVGSTPAPGSAPYTVTGQSSAGEESNQNPANETAAIAAAAGQPIDSFSQYGAPYQANEGIMPQAAGAQFGQAAAQGAQQGMPLPPGVSQALGGQLPGAFQWPQGAVPLLSPQFLAQLSPSERALYMTLPLLQGLDQGTFDQARALNAPSQLKRRTKVRV